ncbi:hypothetical protein NDA13_004667 [Ustilago tritici]|nr:hypothetical protein NDA13_004667 [Ustilago tritici]
MIANTCTLLLANGFTKQNLPEQAIMVIMQENLNLACSVIEKAAMDKAAMDKAAMDKAVPKTCFVYAPMVSCPPSFMSAGGIVGAGAMGAAALQQAGAGANIPADLLPITAGGTLSAQQLLEKFSQGMAELECLLEAADQDAGLSELPQDHEIQHALCLIPMVAAQSSSRDETALALLQKVVQLLFKIDSKLGHGVYVVLLDQLCEILLKAAREVSAWLIYAEDECKFNVPVTVSLVHAGLVNIAELDVQLAKLILRDFRGSVSPRSFLPSPISPLPPPSFLLPSLPPLTPSLIAIKATMLGLKSTVSWSVLLRQLYSRDRGLSHSLATSTLYHSSSLDSSLRHILIDGLDRGGELLFGGATALFGLLGSFATKDAAAAWFV